VKKLKKSEGKGKKDFIKIVEESKSENTSMVSKSDYSFNIEEFLPPGSDYFAKNKVEIRKNLPKNENLFKKKESLFDITKFNVFSPVIDVERFTQKENTGTID